MKRDYSNELKIFLDGYSSSHKLDFSFSCQKKQNQYFIQSKNNKTNEITVEIIDDYDVNNLVEKSDNDAKEEICSVVFKTGPKKTL